MSKSFIIISGIALLLIMGGAIYFGSYINRPSELIQRVNKLQGSLVKAQDKLTKEKNTLGSMINGFTKSYPLAVNVQEQMKRASNIVNKTNSMFKDSSGPNPEFKIKSTLATSADINSQRQEVNDILARWQQETDVLSIKKIDATETEKIKKETEVIQKYIDSLNKIVEGLTTANSDLSQFQIDTYVSLLTSTSSVNEIVASLQATIESFIAQVNHNTETTNQVNSNTTPGANSQTETTEDVNVSNSSTSSTPITLEDIVNQQSVVANAQTEVDTIQEQITTVEQQIQESIPATSTVTTPIETNTEPVPTDGGASEDTSTVSNDVETPGTRSIDSSQGIIIQPGPARLIQGTDPF